MFSTNFVVISLLGLVGSTLGATNHVSSKATAFPNLNLNESGLSKALTLPKSSHKKWEWGTMPEFCYKAATPTPGLSPLYHCNPYDMEVYDLKYSDCGHTWTLCRCGNSTWTLHDAIDIIGRVPVQARQYTRTWATFASIADQESGTWAYSLGTDTSIFDGPNKDGHVPTLVLHENAHTIDYGWNQHHNGSGWVSSGSGWVNAIESDTCVPDGYSKTNEVEDFAQVTVCSSYDKNVGPLSKYGNVTCMSNQLNFVENTIGKTLTQNGTCSVFWQADTVVCMGPGANCGKEGSSVHNITTRSAKFRNIGRFNIGSIPKNVPKFLASELLPSISGKNSHLIKPKHF